MRFSRTYSIPGDGDTSTDVLFRSPELPPALAESMEIMDHPERVDVATVANLVSSDRAVENALLRIVNSAYYGLKRPVEDVERAVVLLGPLTVTGTVMGMELHQLRQYFPGETRQAFSDLIRHSAATAFIGRHLMKEVLGADMADAGLTYTHVGEAFACGMLHDFGKLILLYNHPEAAQSVYKSDEKSVSIREVSDAEVRIFGCDHIAIGADFSAGLGYPDLVTRVIRCHLYPEEHVYDDYADAVLIRATCAADVAASTLRLGFPHALSHDECALHDVWRQIAAFDLPGRHPSAIREEVLRLHDHVLEYVSIVATV